MIQTAIVIGLVVVWFVDDLAYYSFLNHYLKTTFFNQKPFNCAMCISFWAGLGVALATGEYLMPIVASAIAVLITEIKYKLRE